MDDCTPRSQDTCGDIMPWTWLLHQADAHATMDRNPALKRVLDPRSNQFSISLASAARRKYCNPRPTICKHPLNE